MSRRSSPSSKTPKPTNAELDVLRELWEIGPATVREVHAKISMTKSWTYTTTLKTLQVMADKGLVTRDDSERSHVYKAARPANQTQRKLVADLLARAFRGDLDKFVLQAVAAKRPTAVELAEVRSLLDEYERKLR